MIAKKIGIIGCGNMGEALLRRLSTVVEKSTSLIISEYDAKRRGYIETNYKIIVATDNNYLVKYSDVIIIAVKPQDYEKLLKDEICCSVSKDKLIISIAAGITTKYIERIAGKDIPVIRVMPNLPAIIGEAISSISAGTSARAQDISLTKEIFSTIGDVIEVKEELVDAVTAVSGSGPAYFFYLIEALTEAAEELGLDKKTAERLVQKTALGSSKLLEALKEKPGCLRAKVTSKGGTTETAMKIFDSKELKKIVADAVKAACNRSKELSRE